MKVLWLTENYFPNRGGMAQSCDRIIHGLRKKNVEIHVIHFSSRKKSFNTQPLLKGSYTAIPFEEDESHTLNKAWNQISHPNFPKDFDIVLCFGGTLPVLSGPIFSKWLNIPLITMLRGNDFDVALFSPKRQNMLLQNLQSADAVISVSKDKASKIGQLIPSHKVHYVPNGISTKQWKVLPSDLERGLDWKKNNVNKDKKLIGLFGILKAKKGLDFFVNTVSQMAIKSKIHLLLVGEIPQERLDWLESTEISFSVLPFLDRYELLSYYPVCDLVAIPSFYDGMPNVLLEAGSLGIPILASDVDGMKDVLTHAKTGWLFHPGDQNGLRETISSFMQLEEELQTGEALKKEIIERYTEDAEAQQLLDIFQSTLSLTTSTL